MSRKPVRPPASGKSRRAPLASALRVLAALALGWSAGFLWFVASLPSSAPLDQRTDVVVVLTGGQGRLARGLAVLEAGAAGRMLISGVAPATTAAMIAEAAGVPLNRLATTDLGYGTIDTRSNAAETASWVMRRRAASLRVITAAPHMRRALLELSQVLPPDVAILVDAVPDQDSMARLAIEYTKYIARRAALALGLA